jgi:poly-gamma-glutamate synthesis protein (capsule biosynthesis protein)
MRTEAIDDERTAMVLGLAGDVMLGRLVNDVVHERGYAYPWGNTPTLLLSLDAFLVNLECALTRRVEKWRDAYSRPFHFRADPDLANCLRAARVNYASLANNHIGDFGPEGLLDTIAALDAAGIAHSGAGPDVGAARRAAMLTVRGLRVAVLAFADYPDTWAATADRPGLNYTAVPAPDDDFTTVAAAIAEARAAADLVVFSIHWGPNMRAQPPADFIHFAHRVIDAGATIFWGHSAHILQGVEFRGHGVILYDTGDFVDDYAVDAELRNDLGALFVVEAAPHRAHGLSLVPLRIDHMQVNRASGADRTWVVRRMELLCEEFGTVVEERPDGSIQLLAPRHVEAI